MSFPLVENSRWAQFPRELNKKAQSYLSTRDIATRTQLVCKDWHMTPDHLSIILISQIESNQRAICSSKLEEYKKLLRGVRQIPRIIGEIETLQVTTICRWLKLQNAQKLKELDCSLATHILTDEYLEMMTSPLASVRSLNFTNCYKLTQQGFLDTIRKYPNVRSLKFLPGVTDDGLKGVTNIYNELQVISLIHSRVTDEGLRNIAEHYPKNLEQLELDDCYLITNDGLRHLVNLSNLKILNLAHCPQITNPGFKNLAHLSNLEKLDLSLNKLTDSGLESLLQLSILKKLDVHWCNEITDRGLESLAQLSSLEELDLSWCREITDRGVRHLANLPHLKKLNLSHCRQITDAGVQALRSQLPNLVIKCTS